MLERPLYMSIYPQICAHVTVDCDSSMLSMENITWGWRGVQQRMAQGKAVVVDSDWLIWLVRWLKGYGQSSWVRSHDEGLQL